MARDTAKNDSITLGRMPELGEVIGSNFRLDDVMARGGMGVIVRGTQLSMDRTVAIKLLQPQFIGDEDRIKRFEREVHVTKDLVHPNVIQIYDFGQTDGGALYIVMEHLDGEDLQALVDRRAPLPLGRACEITCQMLDGLGAAHERGIVHRDLKPSNIFLLRDRRGNDQVKLLDFGIAKSLEGGSTLTQTGMLCGTPMYMPPESIFQSTPGKPGDVYGVAMIFLEMLMGQRVFDAGEMQQTIMMHLQRPVPVPGPIADTKLGDVLKKAVRKHPDERYADADAMLDDLESVRSSLPGDLRLERQNIAHDNSQFDPDSFDGFSGAAGEGLDYLHGQTSHRSSDAIPNPEQTPPPAQTIPEADTPGGGVPDAEAPTVMTQTPAPAAPPAADDAAADWQTNVSDETTADALESSDDGAGTDDTGQWIAIAAAAVVVLGSLAVVLMPGGGDESANESPQSGQPPAARADDPPSGSDEHPEESAVETQKSAEEPETVEITVESSPSQATVYREDERLGTTPFGTELEADAERTFRLEADGYENTTVSVTPEDRRDYRIELQQKPSPPSPSPGSADSNNAQANPTPDDSPGGSEAPSAASASDHGGDSTESEDSAGGSEPAAPADKAEKAEKPEEDDAPAENDDSTGNDGATPDTNEGSDDPPDSDSTDETGSDDDATDESSDDENLDDFLQQQKLDE